MKTLAKGVALRPEPIILAKGVASVREKIDIKTLGVSHSFSEMNFLQTLFVKKKI